MIQKKEFNRVVDFLKKNINIIKLVGVILISLIVLKYSIILLTPKPQIPDEIKSQLSDLSRITTQLQVSQKKYDSLLIEQNKVSIELDSKISNIREKITIIREYYHEKTVAADKYTPSQVDSFFKNRYKY